MSCLITTLIICITNLQGKLLIHFTWGKGTSHRNENLQRYVKKKFVGFLRVFLGGGGVCGGVEIFWLVLFSFF